MAITRFAEATWNGDLVNGSGSINYVSSGAFARLPVTWASRTEEHNGRTSPEELIASAHAACFSMALFAQLARNGTPATPARRQGRRHVRQARRRLEDREERADGPRRRAGHRRGEVRRARQQRQGRVPGLVALKGNVELSVDASLV